MRGRYILRARTGGGHRSRPASRPLPQRLTMSTLRTSVKLASTCRFAFRPRKDQPTIELGKAASRAPRARRLPMGRAAETKGPTKTPTFDESGTPGE
jgi:hypothetical protein